MCQQCRYEREFFRGRDFTVLVSGELVQPLPDKGRVSEAGSDLQMVYSISGPARNTIDCSAFL